MLWCVVGEFTFHLICCIVLYCTIFLLSVIGVWKSNVTAIRTRIIVLAKEMAKTIARYVKRIILSLCSLSSILSLCCLSINLFSRLNEIGHKFLIQSDGCRPMLTSLVFSLWQLIRWEWRSLNGIDLCIVWETVSSVSLSMVKSK